MALVLEACGVDLGAAFQVWLPGLQVWMLMSSSLAGNIALIGALYVRNSTLLSACSESFGQSSLVRCHQGQLVELVIPTSRTRCPTHLPLALFFSPHPCLHLPPSPCATLSLFRWLLSRTKSYYCCTLFAFLKEARDLSDSPE